MNGFSILTKSYNFVCFMLSLCVNLEPVKFGEFGVRFKMQDAS